MNNAFEELIANRRGTALQPASSRERGKRSNPHFKYQGLYMPVELSLRARNFLLHEAASRGGKGRDLSELVTDILTAYLNNQMPGQADRGM